MMSDALISGGLFLLLLAAIVATSFTRSADPNDVLAELARPAPRHAAPPPAHVGATVSYGRDLARMRTALPSEDLRTVPEQMVADHHALDTISAAQAAFVSAVDAAVARFVEPLPAETRVRLEAAAWQTGELDRAELDRLLAADGDFAAVTR
jgi:hypothetical protein